MKHRQIGFPWANRLLQLKIPGLKSLNARQTDSKSSACWFHYKTPRVHTRDLALTALKNTTPPSLDRHKSGCPVPGVDRELLPACKASTETVSHVLVMRADRRSHSGLRSAFSRRFKTADVLLLLQDKSLPCLTIATGRTHGAQLDLWVIPCSLQAWTRFWVIFQEKFHMARIPVRHAGFPSHHSKQTIFWNLGAAGESRAKSPSSLWHCFSFKQANRVSLKQSPTPFQTSIQPEIDCTWIVEISNEKCPLFGDREEQQEAFICHRYMTAEWNAFRHISQLVGKME